MIITRYSVNGPELKIAQVSDLHGKPSRELYAKLKLEKPDAILVSGDLCTIGNYDDRLVDPDGLYKRLETQEKAIEFLKNAVDIAPVFYSLGNHEWGIDDVYREEVKATGAVLLENEWIWFRDAWIGGQNSAKRGTKYKNGKEIGERNRRPDTDWLKESPEGFKIILCHHPEYYEIVKDSADLVLAGHSHGGHWRFLGRGVFAPGQGFWPRYSKGMYDKMIISAGLTNTTWVPRINNPTELVIVEIEPKED